MSEWIPQYRRPLFRLRVGGRMDAPAWYGDGFISFRAFGVHLPAFGIFIGLTLDYHRAEK